MKSVGEKLRSERERLGIDLATLAGMTRINVRYLEAIEQGNTGDLPGGFFYRSFVRQYATAVGLDSDEIESELERVREAEAPILSAALKESEFPTKQQDPIVAETNRRLTMGRTWALLMLLVAVVVGCSALYAWWHRIETRPLANEVAASENPEVAKPAAPAPKTDEAKGPIGVPVAATPEQTAPVSTTPATAPAPAATVSPDDRVVVNLAATEPTWISFTADGKEIFSGVLESNQTRTLSGKGVARIRVGNAGGLAITWNGKSIGPLGPRGQVRTVVFTPEKYQIVTPTPPAAVPAPDPTGSA